MRLKASPAATSATPISCFLDERKGRLLEMPA